MNLSQTGGIACLIGVNLRRSLGLLLACQLLACCVACSRTCGRVVPSAYLLQGFSDASAEGLRIIPAALNGRCDVNPSPRASPESFLFKLLSQGVCPIKSLCFGVTSCGRVSNMNFRQFESTEQPSTVALYCP